MVISLYIVVFGYDSIIRYLDRAVTITRKTKTHGDLEPPGKVDLGNKFYSL